MTTYIPQHYATATLFKLSVWLHDAAQALRNAAKGLDFLIAARRKAADDRRVVSEMNERELRDIGVNGAHARRFRHGTLDVSASIACDGMAAADVISFRRVFAAKRGNGRAKRMRARGSQYRASPF